MESIPCAFCLFFVLRQKRHQLIGQGGDILCNDACIFSGTGKGSIGTVINLLRPLLGKTLCPFCTAVGFQLFFGGVGRLTGGGALQLGFQFFDTGLGLIYPGKKLPFPALRGTELILHLLQLGLVAVVDKFDIVNHILPVKTVEGRTEILGRSHKKFLLGIKQTDF